MHCKTRWPSEAPHLSLTLADLRAAARWCNTRTRVSLGWVQRSRRSSVSEVCRCFGGAATGIGAETERRLWENHNHASCVWFPARCQEISLCVPDWSYPIPPSSPLAALPTPTLDRTQMVWIKRSAWLGCGYRSLLRSDSLLSLNTPRLDKLKHCRYAVETQGPIGRGCSPPFRKRLCSRTFGHAKTTRVESWHEWKNNKTRKSREKIT